ncbi:MAG: CBS domain-containing protein [Desulfofustis sp.]|nr:CBS domain-containing protein [Desulfofustis sp.]MBT8356074.1 CBS domain-containing protein [Desulfofustis sp.]NNF45905.1 CBS domain-containing protein [Desulfofustis sp.]NNK56150.1 CBS domain-containing protein [Desulfofustis sp.]
MKAKDILADKGTRVVTIHKDNLLVDVMSHFLVNRVGSLVVVNKHDEIMGIVAPVDVLEAVHKDPISISTMTVREVMSENVIVAGPDESMETLMAIMTENRIRHIPIIDEGRLAGIVSIGDAVKAQLTVHEVQISYLKDYIEGKYPA